MQTISQAQRRKGVAGQMTDAEQAQALWQRLIDSPILTNDESVAAIATALAQARAEGRREGLEEAANKCHECLDMTRNDQIVWAQEHLKEMLHGRCQAFANLESWCREQAKEAQP